MTPEQDELLKLMSHTILSMLVLIALAGLIGVLI